MRIRLLLFLLLILPAFGASYPTANFTVSAPTPEFAQLAGDAAEFYRVEIAKLWLGKELPQWSSPCPINVRFGGGAGGKTSFVYDDGEVDDWRMGVQGTPERILDSVLPHEVSHTIFASHFRQPLPRWADEGACCNLEHPAELKKYERQIVEFLKTGRCLPFDTMLTTTEYPADIMPLYAQGHSVSSWLIEKYGHPKFIEFLANGLTDNNWHRAIADVYGFQNARDMQEQWLAWVKSGRPYLAAKPVARIVFAGGRNCGPNGCSPSQMMRAQIQHQPGCPQYQGQRPPQQTYQQPPQGVPNGLTPIERPPLTGTPPTTPPSVTQEPPVNGSDDDQSADIQALLAASEASAQAIAAINIKLEQIKGERGEAGLPGERGHPGEPGPAGGKGDKGDAGSPANTAAIEAQLAELQKKLDHPTPIRVFFPNGTLAGESSVNIFRGESIDFSFNPRALLDQQQ